MLAPPQARPLGARRGGDPAGAVNVDSNASCAREVERKCERARFLLGCAHASQTRPDKRGLPRVPFGPVSRPLCKPNRSSLQCQLPTCGEAPLTTPVQPLIPPVEGPVLTA